VSTFASILVVDDEMGIREGCRRVLAEEGYDIDLAEDGTAGLAKVQEKRYDLILVDLMMPGIGGLDLIQKIHEIDPEIILVVITGYATIETAVEATKRGAYDYLPKPFTPEALSVLVKRGSRNGSSGSKPSGSTRSASRGSSSWPASEAGCEPSSAAWPTAFSSPTWNGN